MLKVVIVEDEIYIRKGIITLLKSLDKHIDIVGEFGSVSQAVKMTSKLQPNLVLLDIQLLDGNAFDFLDQTKEMNFNVIFITSFDNYAIKALKSGAVDYILKPIDVDELSAAIDKVVLLEKEQELKIKIGFQCEKISLNFVNEIQVIDLKQLIYCKSNKGYTTFHMLNGKEYMASKPLKEFAKNLSNCQFIRTHQSYFVNSVFINRFDSKKRVLHLINNTEVPVSFRRIAVINKILNI